MFSPSISFLINVTIALFVVFSSKSLHIFNIKQTTSIRMDSYLVSMSNICLCFLSISIFFPRNNGIISMCILWCSQDIELAILVSHQWNLDTAKRQGVLSQYGCFTMFYAFLHFNGISSTIFSHEFSGFHIEFDGLITYMKHTERSKCNIFMNIKLSRPLHFR